jgi:hypothetical protein
MRKIIISITVLILIIFLLFFCRNDEKKVNLGRGYYYIPFQEVVFDVTRFGGNGIYMCRNNLKVPIIFPEIKNYKYDSMYIIIKQKFDMETRYLIENMISMPNLYFDYDKKLVFLDEKYIKGINTDRNADSSDKFITDIMYKDKNIKKMIENKVNYYIIDKKNSRTFGPFKYEEFENLKSKMNIKIDF